jgi:alpha-galactosidase
MQTDTLNSRFEITAASILGEIRLDAGNPAQDWNSAELIRFDSDWQGKNADPALETEVALLWSPTTLFMRFVCHYREQFVFEDSDSNGRRDHLWDRDVAEAFLQPPDSFRKSAHVATDALVRGAERSSAVSSGVALPRTGEDARFQKVEGDYDTPYASYKEFEVAPNGMWIDLDIIPSGRGDLKSGMTCSVHVDEKSKVWTAELAIPMKALTTNFDPKATWRVNFYRVEGKVEPRKYMAWQPTMTPQPNFHVPERFGSLRFK